MTSERGFSLVEVLVSLTITLGIGLIVFQFFQQNERLFRDQSLFIEMQQGARAAALQIADELRMAGQGVPLYAAAFDEAASEAVAVILPSSTAARIDFRAGLSLAETRITSPLPLELALSASQAVTVTDASLFAARKFAYVWGETEDSMWTWARVELSAISGSAFTITPRQTGRPGVVRFARPPALSLDEATSFHLSGATLRRAAASDMTNPAAPAWSAAQEIGRNIVGLTFAYYDRNNDLVLPDSLANRMAIARVDVQVVAQTSSELSTGSRAAYALSLRTIPRNLRVR